MVDYATIADVKLFARQPDALADEGWQLLVSSASRLFDIVCEVETDFFARPPNPQYYDGNDSQLLPIDALTPARRVESVTIENDAYTVPAYSVAVVGPVTSLDAGAGGKWHSGSRVVVRADWAPSDTPQIAVDVSQAVAEMAVHIWRKSDPSFASISSAENSILLEELPPTARATATKYRAAYSNRCLFA
jgi:hypothetical protein